MKRGYLPIFCALAMSSSVAVAQEFTTTPRRVAPQPAPRAPVEQNSNSDIVTKFRRARNKFHLVNPLAPPEYGSGQQVLVADIQDPKERPKFWRLFSINF
jgi:hypothetical protein